MQAVTARLGELPGSDDAEHLDSQILKGKKGLLFHNSQRKGSLVYILVIVLDIRMYYFLPPFEDSNRVIPGDPEKEALMCM